MKLVIEYYPDLTCQDCPPLKYINVTKSDIDPMGLIEFIVYELSDQVIRNEWNWKIQLKSFSTLEEAEKYANEIPHQYGKSVGVCSQWDWSTEIIPLNVFLDHHPAVIQKRQSRLK